MTHSARHPCPWCHWVKGENTYEADLRTFEGIIANYQNWLRDTDGDKVKLKEYFNCQGVPLPIFPPNGQVLDFIPLPELHKQAG